MSSQSPQFSTFSRAKRLTVRAARLQALAVGAQCHHALCFSRSVVPVRWIRRPEVFANCACRRNCKDATTGEIAVQVVQVMRTIGHKMARLLSSCTPSLRTIQRRRVLRSFVHLVFQLARKRVYEDYGCGAYKCKKIVEVTVHTVTHIVESALTEAVHFIKKMRTLGVHATTRVNGSPGIGKRTSVAVLLSRGSLSRPGSCTC